MKTWLRMVAQRLKVRLHYRADLAISGVGDVLLAAVGLLFLTTLFRNVAQLGAWGRPEVLFCWGFAEAVVGLFFFAFQGLYHQNPRYILGGELDRVLLRPIDPLVHILLDNISLESLPIAGLGIGVMAWVAPALDVPPLHWALLPLMLVSATAVVGGLLTAISSLAFYLHHRGTAVGLVFQIAIFNRYPLDLFAPALRWILTVVLPLGFAGFYPASLYLGRAEWYVYGWVTPLVGALCAGLGWWAWHRGLSRYCSAGG